MVPEILRAWLWQARLAIHGGAARAFAAHGYVDPAYRPSRLPFVSVVGPLSLQLEPERENGRTGQALLRTPGFVIGQERQPAATVPAAGGLRLRFDGRATVTIALAGLPATPFSDEATGPAIAQAIRTALAAGAFLEPDGSPITDPAYLAALQTITVMWSQELRQLAISSDLGTAATAMRSSVEVLPTATDLAPALGLAPPAAAVAGRQRLHRLPPPRSMTVEMRLDLWAESQVDMGQMFDGLALAAPTRGRLALRPSLLAADASDGSAQIRLLDRGEPTTLVSLVHLEGGDGLVDRARGAIFTLAGAAASDPAGSRFTLEDDGALSGRVYSTPLVPDQLFAPHPMPAGFAIALGLGIDPGSADGDEYALLRLRRGNDTVASLTMQVVTANVPNEGAVTFGEVVARATMTSGAVTGTSETRWRIRLATLEAPGTLHATIAADRAIALAWEGEPQRLDDPVATPSAPTIAAGRPAAGPDMVLELGGGADPLPQPIAISHVHILREPYGPLDPRLRTSLAGPAQLRPGDMIALAGSDDGWHLGERRALAIVVEVAGNQVVLSKPVIGNFRRGATLVYQDECFYFQTAVKRRDDLMNRLYHCSLDYKVSALLEDPAARNTAVLVREAVTELTARGASRAAGGHPGVTVVEADSPRGPN